MTVLARFFAQAAAPLFLIFVSAFAFTKQEHVRVTGGDRLERNFKIHYKKPDGVLSPVETTTAPQFDSRAPLSKSANTELNSIFEKMPENEKYSMILQSYAVRLLEENRRDFDLLTTIENLYLEMILKSIKPELRACQSFIDAASTFCSVERLSKAVRLIRAGGGLKVFGVANGRLTTPIVQRVDSALLSIELPSDERESEVLLAGSLLGSGAFWIAIQGLGAINTDVHPWATLYSTLLLGLLSADIVVKQGASLRTAAAGIDRLVLRDAERQAHCDGAAFLVGYLLGLPCFCFKPDVNEALNMYQSSAFALNAYKQPAAIRASTAFGRGGGGAAAAASKWPGGGIGGDTDRNARKDASIVDRLMKNFSRPPSPSPSSSTVSTAASTASAATAAAENAQSRVALEKLDMDLDIYSLDSASEEEAIENLGRLLVWLMAPVAAEMLKYGKTVLSDPRRGERLLDELYAAQQENKNTQKRANNPSSPSPSAAGGSTSSSTTTKITTSDSVEENKYTTNNNNNDDINYTSFEVPKSAEDRNAFLQWAYFEATALVRQYGDLLEDVQSFMGTGTSTVGECAIMIEDEISR